MIKVIVRCFFGTYNHRFENSRCSMQALKLLEKLKIFLLLSYSCESFERLLFFTITIIAGKT